jgi:hypothetical protein
VYVYIDTYIYKLNWELEPMASVIIYRDEETPLVVESLIQFQPHKSHTRDVHVLSIAFLLIFLAYGASQNLQSTLNTVSYYL